MQSRGTPLRVHFGVDQTSKYSKTTRSLIAAQKNGSFAPGCRLHEEYLAQAAHKLDLVGVDFIVIASNTAHICYSPMATLGIDDIQLGVKSTTARNRLIMGWMSLGSGET
jgi:hypothetical protein